MMMMAEGYFHAIQVDDPRPFALLPQWDDAWLSVAVRCGALKCVRVIAHQVPREDRGQAPFYVVYGPLASNILRFLLSVDGIDVNTHLHAQDRSVTLLDRYCSRLTWPNTPLAEHLRLQVEENIRILIDHGACIADWHPTWVRNYHAARQAALEARTRAAYSLLAMRFVRHWQLSKDVACLLACAIKKSDWHSWIVHE